MKDNSKQSYQKYLLNYPNGRYSGDVEKKLNELENENWEIALKDSSSLSYAKYLKAYPNGKYNQDARKILEELHWSELTKINSYWSYRFYLNMASFRINKLESVSSYSIIDRVLANKLKTIADLQFPNINEFSCFLEQEFGFQKDGYYNKLIFDKYLKLYPYEKHIIEAYNNLNKLKKEIVTIKKNPIKSGKFIISGLPIKSFINDTLSFEISVLDEDYNHYNFYKSTINFKSTDPFAILPDEYKFNKQDMGNHKFVNALIFRSPGDHEFIVYNVKNPNQYSIFKIRLIDQYINCSLANFP